MRTRRIELEADAGHVAIERAPAPGSAPGSENRSPTIRIDSIIRDPLRGQQAWKTWELPVDINDADLFKVAIEVQFRTDGRTGTDSDILEYFEQMHRFRDRSRP